MIYFWLCNIHEEFLKEQHLTMILAVADYFTWFSLR